MRFLFLIVLSLAYSSHKAQPLSANDFNSRHCFEILAELPETDAAAPKTQYSSSPILAVLIRHFPELGPIYSKDAGVQEKITLESHTQNVLAVFKEQERFYDFSQDKIPSDIRLKALFRVALALHDIGKPAAVEKGNIFLQHQFTEPMLRKYFKKLGFTTKETELAVSLVNNDILGELLQERLSVDNALEQINKLAKTNNLSSSAFLKLQTLFFTSDAASYFRVRESAFRRTNDGQLVPFKKIYLELKDLAAAYDIHGLAKLDEFKGEQQTRQIQLKDLSGKITPLLRDPWGTENFTNPKNHDPTHFQYIVHASPEINMLRRYLDGVPLSSQQLLSTSLISEKLTNTWANMGLILNAPKETIYSAHQNDMFSQDSALQNGMSLHEKLEQNFAKYKLPSPSEIIAQGNPTPGWGVSYHTEVLITGSTPENKKVTTSGIFLKVDSLGNTLVPPSVAQEVEKIAKRHKLPLILIGPSEGYFTVKMRTTDKPSYTFYDLLNKTSTNTVIVAEKNAFEGLRARAKKENKPIIVIEEDSPTRSHYGMLVGDEIEYYPDEKVQKENRYKEATETILRQKFTLVKPEPMPTRY